MSKLLFKGKSKNKSRIYI